MPEEDILSEVKVPNPYHVIYEVNEGLEARAKWYVVHTYSGHELKVAEQLKVRIASMGVVGKIFEVVIPAQDKIQVKKGQKKTVKEKILPGYILIKMIVDTSSTTTKMIVIGLIQPSDSQRKLTLYEIHGSQSSQVQEYLYRGRSRQDVEGPSPISWAPSTTLTKPRQARSSSRFGHKPRSSQTSPKYQNLITVITVVYDPRL